MRPRPRRLYSTALLLLVVALPFPALCLWAQEGVPVAPRLGRIELSLGEQLWNGRDDLVLTAVAEFATSCADAILPARRDSADATILERWSTPRTPACMIEGVMPTGIVLPWSPAVRTLIVRHLEREDRYRITITGDLLHIDPLAPPRVSAVSQASIWRRPRNALRASCGTKDTRSWYCAELFRALAEVRGIHPLVVPVGALVAFGLPATASDARLERARLYRYDDDQSVERAKAALRRVANSWGGGASVMLWTSESWDTSGATWMGQ
jgi:hypothetical protein